MKRYSPRRSNTQRPGEAHQIGDEHQHGGPRARKTPLKSISPIIAALTGRKSEFTMPAPARADAPRLETATAACRRAHAARRWRSRRDMEAGCAPSRRGRSPEFDALECRCRWPSRGSRAPAGGRCAQGSAGNTRAPRRARARGAANSSAPRRRRRRRRSSALNATRRSRKLSTGVCRVSPVAATRGRICSRRSSMRAVRLRWSATGRVDALSTTSCQLERMSRARPRTRRRTGA